MEHSSSLSTGQEIRLSWKLKVNYRIHKSPTLVPILRLMSAVNILKSYFSLNYTLMLPCYPGLSNHSGFLLSGVQIKILQFLFSSPILATCYFPACRVMLRLITLTMPGEICPISFSDALYCKSTKRNPNTFLDMKHGNEYRASAPSLSCVHFTDIFADLT
jgi:hypothetical protein